MMFCKMFHKFLHSYLYSLYKQLYNPIDRHLYILIHKRLYTLFYKFLDMSFCKFLYISRHKWNHTQRSNYLYILLNNQYNLKMIVEDNRMKTVGFEMDYHLYYYPHNHVCTCLYIRYSIRHRSYQRNYPYT